MTAQMQGMIVSIQEVTVQILLMMERATVMLQTLENRDSRSERTYSCLLYTSMQPIKKSQGAVKIYATKANHKVATETEYRCV